MSGLTSQLLALGIALLTALVWVGTYRYLCANLKQEKRKSKPQNVRPRPAAGTKEEEEHE